MPVTPDRRKPTPVEPTPAFVYAPPMTTYEGEFKPPALGSTSAPFPIAGRGRCEVSDDGLTIHGFRASKGLAVLMALVGALAAGGGALAVKLLLFPGMTAGTIGAVIAVGLVSGAALPQKAREDQPLTLTIPWSSIKKIGRDTTGKLPQLITIVVKKGKPKGTIHFVVDGDPDLLSADLQTRI